ncbi:MAG: cation transporter dimerization domain-containing protein, partial [Candidatus Jordarchaeales archaeon]
PNVEEVNVHLEALEEDVVKSSESVVSEELVGKVREAVESFSVKFPKYEVEVKNYDGESNIYITIYVDGSMPLGEAYEISSELKDYIIRNLPSVENIIIDVEPYPKKDSRSR